MTTGGFYKSQKAKWLNQLRFYVYCTETYKKWREKAKGKFYFKTTYFPWVFGYPSYGVMFLNTTQNKLMINRWGPGKNIHWKSFGRIRGASGGNSSLQCQYQRLQAHLRYFTVHSIHRKYFHQRSAKISTVKGS